MENTKRLWILLGAVIFSTMFILGWFIISVIILLAGIGALVWYKVFTDWEEELPVSSPTGPIRKVKSTHNFGELS